MDTTQKITLASPEGSPYRFNVEITERIDNGFKSFDIAAEHPQSRKKISKIYTINGSSHDAYLDLFHYIAQDFGLRIPKNRETENAAQDGKDIAYQIVLAENLDKDMYYGYGDPAILSTKIKDETWYYLVSTSNDAANAFPIIKSRDLKNWEFSNYIFPAGTKPEWANEGELVSDYWAPEMHQIGDEFRTYFVARDKENKQLCIGLVRSATPEGNYISEKEPLISGNVIDPHLFVQDAQTSYLFWKEDNNDIAPGKISELLFKNPSLISRLFPDAKDQATAAFTITLWRWAMNLPAMERFFVLQLLIESVIEQYFDFEQRLVQIAKEQENLANDIAEALRYMKTPMYIQQLSKDGTKLIGERKKILENDMLWEAHLVEGMWLSFHQNKYYLFYAGNDFSTDNYGIGIAVADQLMGPYVKQDQPLLKSTKSWLAPGHPSVLKTENGAYHLFLHAYFPGEAGYKKFRALLQLPIVFDNGNVVI